MQVTSIREKLTDILSSTDNVWQGPAVLWFYWCGILRHRGQLKNSKQESGALTIFYCIRSKRHRTYDLWIYSKFYFQWIYTRLVIFVMIYIYKECDFWWVCEVQHFKNFYYNIKKTIVYFIHSYQLSFYQLTWLLWIFKKYLLWVIILVIALHTMYS